jgi:hypothetical protein
VRDNFSHDVFGQLFNRRTSWKFTHAFQLLVDEQERPPQDSDPYGNEFLTE